MSPLSELLIGVEKPSLIWMPQSDPVSLFENRERKQFSAGLRLAQEATPRWRVLNMCIAFRWNRKQLVTVVALVFLSFGDGLTAAEPSTSKPATSKPATSKPATSKQTTSKQTTLKLATFYIDATPPLGSPVAYAPARKIEDPLYARGIVLLGAGKPIVLCAVDWIGISNDGNTVWREKLATAAGTTADRVTVHTLHQHDGPRCDFRAEELLAKYGFAGKRYDVVFLRDTIERAGQAIRKAIPKAQPVTHLGVGQAEVKKVASNRRILGPDGKVKIVRFSKTKNPEAIAAPEGVIDPALKLISFWNKDQPLASLTYYATHPQSYYGKGDVTSEFVGLARARRQKALPNMLHVHFNGAGGNVAAGKYNDGSPEARVTLTNRMEAGMKAAWENTVREPISAKDVQWRSVTVRIPVAPYLHEDKLRAEMKNNAQGKDELNARKLAWVERDDGHGVPIDLTCLHLKNVEIVHMPGELFVEYQLAAQKMAPDETVCMAAYGDYGPGYIGTEIAYSQGGYETSQRASNVAPEVEKVLMNGLRKLLKPRQ